VLGEGGCAGQGGAGAGDGAAPQRGDRAGLRPGAGAGGEGGLLGPGGGGRAPQPVPDAGAAAQLPLLRGSAILAEVHFSCLCSSAAG